jgi:zinc and cadmium transporter
MSETLVWILIITILNSLLGLVGIFSLWIREKTLKKILLSLVAFSAGTLFAGGLFHLLAESLDFFEPTTAFIIFTLGFIAFFIIEEYLHWHHCRECDIHTYSYLMIIGDCIHNFIDGLIIAGSFFVSVPMGLVTSIIILGHELPQELGIFAVIVHGGIKKRKAILYSFLAQTFCVFGGIIGFLLSSNLESFSKYLLPFAAGGFIYISAADLIPEIHKSEGWKRIVSFIWLIIGIIFMVAVKFIFE